VATRDDNLTFEDARIIFRNFEGRKTMYNDEGKRNFSLVLSPEQWEDLKVDGWNVKDKPGREEGDDPLFHLPVTVSFRGKRPPRLVLLTSRGRNTLDESTALMIDWADIEKVDLIVRPYDWEVSGKTGRKAYLVAIYVTIHEDALELKYADIEEIGSRQDEPEEYTEFVGDEDGFR
jgi:hypothetical protein